MRTTRREFLASTLMATMAAPNVFSESRYRVGITTNTRGGLRICASRGASWLLSGSSWERLASSRLR